MGGCRFGKESLLPRGCAVGDGKQKEKGRAGTERHTGVVILSPTSADHPPGVVGQPPGLVGHPVAIVGHLPAAIAIVARRAAPSLLVAAGLWGGSGRAPGL